MTSRVLLTLAYGAGFFLLFKWLWRRRAAKGAAADQSWELFAKLHGLERPDPRIRRYEGQNQEFPFVLDLVWNSKTKKLFGGRLTSYRENPPLVTRMGVYLPGLPASLRVEGKTWRNRLFGLLAGPRIETGDQAFDDRVFVRAAEAGQALEYLNAERRRALLSLFGSQHSARIEDGWLRVQRRRQVQRLANLEGVFRDMGAVAHDLAAGPVPPFVPPFYPADRPQSDPSRTPTRVPWFGPLAIAMLGMAAIQLGWQFAGLHETTPASHRESTVVYPARPTAVLDVWELHPDDRVLFVTLLHGQTVGSDIRAGAPFLTPESRVVSETPIGGALKSRTESRRNYRGRNYLLTEYRLTTSSPSSGIEMLIDGLPHLRLQGGMRLLSVGADPQTRYSRRLVCVAIPEGSDSIEWRDFAPFQRSRVGEWEVLFYDTASIKTHVSIHVKYRPGPDAPPLDWRDVAPPEWQPSVEATQEARRRELGAGSVGR
ncbi:MAG: hypothetical protein JXO72_13130 [Vicinamibacteria bacterium]|nr:hypothetical protein [Vicinamibacteria bacterium]